jgi:CheY-like chemotaxis protein
MARILLVHWHVAEAETRARHLRAAGHVVVCHTQMADADIRAIRANPPDAVVIDLARVPSHGSAMGVWLRQQKATRHVPLVFVEGDPEKTQRVKAMLPDAVFTPWSRVRSALRGALKSRPQQPVRPGIMAPYAGTPLPRKLGVKAGVKIALLGAPAGFEHTLGPLPEGAALRRDTRLRADVILLFVKSRAALERGFPRAARALAEGGRLWLVWPKQASGIATDVTQNVVRAFGLERGFVDYKISAIDATWSGLCFARRATRA